jgi:uncharacterized protein (TIGR02118 family)
MYKVAWLARFPQGLTKEEGRRHWAERHAPMCVKTPGIDRYVQNHVMGALPGRRDEEPQFDGYSCGWWADEDAFRASMDTDEWRALVADGDNVFDMSWLEGMSAQVEEHVVIDGEPGPYKVAWVAKFKPGMSNADGRAYWATTHGPIIADLPDIDRYVQNHCVAPVGGGGEARDPLRFDGFSEAWFADEAAYLRAVNSPTWDRLHEDGFNVFDPDLLWGVRLDERIVQAGTLAGAI